MRARAGKANSEFVLYMTLLLVLGLLVFSLAAAGSGAYAKLVDRKDRDASLRVAISYLEVQVRRHDAAGAISLAANPFGDGTALVLRDDAPTVSYETIVYCKDGTLRTLLSVAGGERSEDFATDVASVASVDLSPAAGGLRIRVTSDDGAFLESFVGLRAPGALR